MAVIDRSDAARRNFRTPPPQLVIPAKAGIHVDLAVALAPRSPRRLELATGNRRPEGRRAGRAPCATQAMDGLCGAS
ncbi:hypothetical protein, partial [Lysobacter enzymogenes]|uniref:hypothetical protein n=1 Tax=Lysobacter enzymogenes TaxID=69 RepID=UPI001B8B60B8